MSPRASSSPAWVQHWFRAAVAMSVLCVLVTWRAPSIHSWGFPWNRLVTFGLAGENSVGAWWSGMLLLAVGLHAFDGFLRQGARQRVGIAWLVLALLMCLLSMDEVSSLHERIIGGMKGFAVLYALGGGFVMATLFAAGQRRAAFWIAAGFGAFAFAEVQDEFLEHLQLWQGRLSLRQTLEEGSELVGMLFLLHAAIPNTFDFASARSAPSRPPFEIITRALPALVNGGLVLAPVLAYFSATLPDHGRGHSAAWQAAAALFMAAVVMLPTSVHAPRAFAVSRYGMAVICVSASALVVWIGAFLLPTLNKVAFSGFCVAVGILWRLSGTREHWETHRLLLSISASLMLVMWAVDYLMVTYWAEATAATLMLYGNALLVQQRVLGRVVLRPTDVGLPVEAAPPLPAERPAA